jgi:glycosyltransferase involved in cell wall biosynthesis
MAEASSEDPKKLPLLSVIITSYTLNRLRDIYSLLDSIKKQTYPNIEVIFVAEKSRKLYKKVKEYCEEIGLPRFKILWNEGVLGASAARNLGIKSAKGEIIAFVDDDVVLFSDWAEKMVRTYNDNSIIGVTGAALPLWEDPSMSWLPEEFHWLVSCTSWFNTDEITKVRNVWTENASFRKKAFEIAGLFATHIGPRGGSMTGRRTNLSEDVEISLRIRKKTAKHIVYNPEVKVWHKVYRERLQWRNIIQWSYWIGFSKRMLKKLYDKASIGMEPIEQEEQLLKRILFRLFSKTVKDFFKKPTSALRIILFEVAVLFFVGLGYFFCFHFPKDKYEKDRNEEKCTTRLNKKVLITRAGNS